MKRSVCTMYYAYTEEILGQGSQVTRYYIMVMTIFGRLHNTISFVNKADKVNNATRTLRCFIHAFI